MSKLMKKFTGSKNVSISVKMDSVEVLGKSVVDKDMFCIHWSMKGLRGHDSTGTTDNVRAAPSEGGEQCAVARFPDIFNGEIQVRPRKDNAGYDAAEFEMRIVLPALHKKDEKIFGRATLNILEKVPILTPGQPYPAKHTVPLNKEGSAVAYVNLTFQIKGDAPPEELTEPAPEPERAASPLEQSESSSRLLVKTPPATPSKDAGSESGSTAVSEVKEESESKRSHRKRRSSNSSAMAALTLKKKEEEFKQKETEFEEEKKKMTAQIVAQTTEIDDLKKANQHLEDRVRELEQAKEQTDVDVINPAEEQMQENLRNLQARNEELQEKNVALVEERDQAEAKIRQLLDELEAAKSGQGDDSKDKELAILKAQLQELKGELGKKNDGAPAAPAKNPIVMQAIFAAVGAVLGLILGHMF